MDPNNVHHLVVEEVAVVAFYDWHMGFRSQKSLAVVGNLVAVHCKLLSLNKLDDRSAVCRRHHNGQNRNRSVGYDKLMTMHDGLAHHNDCNHSHDLVAGDRSADDHIRVDGICPTKWKKQRN